VNSNLQNSDLVYRKLKISDYHQFRKLFYFCFKKKISFDFFRWRYFNNSYSFCFGVFKSSKLIANVGMVSMKLNNNSKEKIFSRHSSMVLKKYRGYGVFSNLLDKVKKKISKKVRFVVMWPNKNNFANFGINKNAIIKKKYFLYESNFKSKFKIKKKTENYDIKKLVSLKKLIEHKNNFFFKNFTYFKNRYLLYKKNEYFINKFEFRNFASYFIIKRNKDKLGLNFVILDHFGSKKLKSRHLSILVNEQKRLLFLSRRRIYKTQFKLLNSLNLKIGIINKFNLKYKNRIFFEKEIFLGDTDIFMTIGHE